MNPFCGILVRFGTLNVIIPVPLNALENIFIPVSVVKLDISMEVRLGQFVIIFTITPSPSMVVKLDKFMKVKFGQLVQSFVRQ